MRMPGYLPLATSCRAASAPGKRRTVSVPFPAPTTPCIARSATAGPTAFPAGGMTVSETAPGHVWGRGQGLGGAEGRDAACTGVSSSPSSGA